MKCLVFVVIHSRSEQAAIAVSSQGVHERMDVCTNECMSISTLLSVFIVSIDSMGDTTKRGREIFKNYKIIQTQ